LLTNISLLQSVGASQSNSSFHALLLQKLHGLMNSKDITSDRKINLITMAQNFLKVIAKMGNFLPLDDAKACFSELYSNLESFPIPIELISATVNAALIILTKQMCYDSRKDVLSKVSSSSLTFPLSASSLPKVANIPTLSPPPPTPLPGWTAPAACQSGTSSAS
jgi:hypothetical protein